MKYQIPHLILDIDKKFYQHFLFNYYNAEYRGCQNNDLTLSATYIISCNFDGYLVIPHSIPTNTINNIISILKMFIYNRNAELVKYDFSHSQIYFSIKHNDGMLLSDKDIHQIIFLINSCYATYNANNRNTISSVHFHQKKSPLNLQKSISYNISNYHNGHSVYAQFYASNYYMVKEQYMVLVINQNDFPCIGISEGYKKDVLI